MGKYQKNKMVMFDFDGVIVDTFEMCYELNILLESRKNISREEYADLFMGNLFDAIYDESYDKKRKDKEEEWFDQTLETLCQDSSGHEHLRH